MKVAFIELKFTTLRSLQLHKNDADIFTITSINITINITISLLLLLVLLLFI